MGTCLLAQTFPGQGGVLIPPGAPGQTVGISTSVATVSGIGILGEECKYIDNVTMDVNHTFVGDIALFLISPSGQVLELSSGNGGAGDNFKITVFTDFTVPFITQGAPPYNGTFRPEGRQQNTDPPFSNDNPLGTYTFFNTFNGVNADGDWVLLVNDYVPIDVGIINSWSITFATGTGPEPVVDLGPDITVCPEESVTLLADINPAPDWIYWSTGATVNPIVVTPLMTTDYSIVVASNGCFDTDTIQLVIENPGLTADAGPDMTVCEGETVTLNGSGGGPGATYSWSTGQTGSSIDINPTMTAVYTLTVTEGDCAFTDNVFVIVIPSPTADAGPDVEICTGQSVDLEASGGVFDDDYMWSTGESGAEITVSPVITTEYTVTINSSGCEAIDQVVVTVVPGSSVDAGMDQDICLGDDATLIATGGSGTYTWSTGQTSDQITVSPLFSTTYSVTLEDNGCESIDEVDVNVIEVEADAGFDQAICEGESVTLTASGGSDYEWSTGEFQSSITVTPTMETTYIVTVSIGSCSDVASVGVEVFESPTASISPDETICEGESVLLVAGGGGTYEWSTGETSAEIFVTPAQTTTYFVTVTDQGCSSFAETTVTVNPTPAASAGPDQNICEGETAILQGSGGGLYEWSTGASTSLIEVTPATTMLFTLTVTDFSGCTATDEAAVIVNMIPIADAGPNQFVMVGGNAVLMATGGGIYAWSTGEMTQSITVSPLTTTTYSVTVTLGNCISIDEVTVFVDEVPSVDLGPDLEICTGESITIDASIAGPFLLTYSWSTGEMTSMIQVSPMVDTSYSVTVTNTTTGFSTIDTILVDVLSFPLGTPEITGPVVMCAGENGSYIAISVTGATQYEWSVSSGGTILSGQGTPQIDVEWSSSGVGIVQVIVSNECGALPAVSLDVAVDGPPLMPGPIAGDANPCAEGSGSYEIPVVPGAVTYQWTLTGGGIILSGQGTEGIMIDWNGAAGGELCVTATNACGTSMQTCLTIVTTTTPVLSAGDDDTVCGLTYSLQGTGTGSWAMVNGPGTISFSNESLPTSMITVSVEGVYVLSYSSSQSGCIGYDETEVTFLTTPLILNLVEDCQDNLEGYTVSFQVAGGLSPYLVNGMSIMGDAFTSGIVLAGSSYSFQAEDSNGCLSPVVNGVQECLCTTSAGMMASDEIKACISDTINVPFLGGSISIPGDVLGFVLYEGQLPDGVIAWNTVSEFVFQPPMVAGQTYFVAAVNGQPGLSGFPDLLASCTAISNSTPVIFNAPPIALLNDQAVLPCDPMEAILDIGASATGPDIQYKWTTSNGGIIVGPTNTPEVLVITPGIYQLSVTDGNTGCTAVDEINVEMSTFIPVDFELEVHAPSCPGLCDGAMLVTSAQDGWTYDYGDGLFVTDTAFHVACSGESTLIIRNEFGCTADTFYSVPESAGVSVDLGPDQTITYGDQITLTAQSESIIEIFNWFDADTCMYCPSIEVKPAVSTTYIVQVTDEKGCMDTDEVIITVKISRDIYVPNIFSPNADQINDVFFIEQNDRIDRIMNFEIFDRWGNLVFQHDDFVPGDPADGWDGTYRGEAMNPAVYTWRIGVKYLDGVEEFRAGDVTLVK